MRIISLFVFLILLACSDDKKDQTEILASSCPDPLAEGVDYKGNSQLECAAIDFLCEEPSYVMFHCGQGCGCNPAAL